MVDPAVKEIMANALFSADDFEQIWMDLNQLYGQLEFSDQISDEQRISEYKYIAQQVRKFIGSKKGEIMACESIADMVDKVEAIMVNSRKYGDTRQDIAYNFYRDHWLKDLYNILSQMAVSEAEEDE